MFEDDEFALGATGRFDRVITDLLFLELVLSESEDSTRRRSGREVIEADAIMGEKEPGARGPLGALDMVFMMVRVYLICDGVSHVL